MSMTWNTASEPVMMTASGRDDDQEVEETRDAHPRGHGDVGTAQPPIQDDRDGHQVGTRGDGCDPDGGLRALDQR